MTQPVPREVLLKVRKLVQLAADLRRGQDFSVTRLTSLKSLCQEPDRANRFVTYLARKTLERVEQGKGRSGHPGKPKDLAHRRMMAEALAEMEAWLQNPTESRRQGLWDTLVRMQAEQNEVQRIQWGSVRIVRDWDLLLFEDALRCLLNPGGAGHWAYQMARDYAERYDARHFNGLVPRSAPLVQDIADFWCGTFGLDAADLAASLERRPKQEKHPGRSKPSRRSGGAGRKTKKGQGMTFTHRQGQFLAFIHLYRKLHRQGPAELDMVKYFRVTPPSVHGMVVKLAELGLITREPGVSRSARVAVPAADLPELEDVAGPPW
jgi:hypothetical protein